MKLILLEGQPGSGKSTLGQVLHRTLVNSGQNCTFVDEYRQDKEIFTDYWEDVTASPEKVASDLKQAWGSFIQNSIYDNGYVIVDNALLNQVQYLMALNAKDEIIVGYFNALIDLLAEVELTMVFFDGNSEVIIKRVYEVRKNGWGERVIELIASTPYQRERKRTGLDGMVHFFADAQALKRRFLQKWPYKLLSIDVTEAEWEKYEQAIHSLLIE